MTTAILFAPFYDASADDRAYAARALALAYASQGIHTHVLCPLTPAPFPSFDVQGPLTIHRLNLPTHATPNSFAARAAARLAELAASRPCDILICFDAPHCVAAARALHLAGGHHAPIIHLLTAPPSPGPFTDLADHTVHLGRSSQHPAADPLARVPLVPGLWIPPQGDDHAIILPALAAPEHTTLLARAFAQAHLAAQGWSLRLAGPTGRWLTASETSAPPPPGRPRRMVALVTDATGDPIAARLAVVSGSLILATAQAPIARELIPALTYTTTQSLTAALRTIACATDDTFRAWTTQQHTAIAAPADPSTLNPQHRAAWNALPTLPRRAPLHAFWQNLERSLQSTSTPAPEHAA